ncbi:MAG: FliI/YscN family ATPase [Fimbriimonadaceae bacterium]|nr:FliI/YscN family ATPase [Fimbriimonadaceae bacterium]
MVGALVRTPRVVPQGRVVRVVGLTIESAGPRASVGDLCFVQREGHGGALPAEVVGLREGKLILMPLERKEGVRPGDLVATTGEGLSVPAGKELLGRVLDALGRPMDGKPLPFVEHRAALDSNPPNPLTRKLITEQFGTGVGAMDAVTTVGIGQRLGVFAGSGVGKSTLLGMIARYGQADVNVVGLIGERGREVREFLENDLGEEGLAKSVVVCATGDEPAVLRAKAAQTATALAEHFRDQGMSVLLMMDSLTRYAMALREIGLAAGEPPATRGYPPSVFAAIPRLLERAGQGQTGAITGIYTVLVEGDDTNEPVADTVRAVLDGHIVLSRKLTGMGHYPPIAVTQSLSRVMPFVTSEDHVHRAEQVRAWVAAHEEVEDLVAIGAYKPGTKPMADAAIERWPAILELLRQDRSHSRSPEQSLAKLVEVTS